MRRATRVVKDVKECEVWMLYCRQPFHTDGELQKHEDQNLGNTTNRVNAFEIFGKSLQALRRVGGVARRRPLLLKDVSFELFGHFEINV